MGWERVVGQRRVRRSADDVVCGVAFALEQQVGLADGVGFGVDFLAVEMGGDLFAPFPGEFPERVFGHGQHAAGAAGAVIEQVGAGLDLIGNRQEEEIGHQLDGVARRPVFAGFFVVFLVEPSHQLLKDRAHAVIVEAGVLDGAVGILHRIGAQVDVGCGQFLDQRAERVGFGEARDLVVEFEVFEDVLDVGREAVQVCLEVRPKLLLSGAGFQVPQGERGRVVEGVLRGGP